MHVASVYASVNCPSDQSSSFIDEMFWNLVKVPGLCCSGLARCQITCLAIAHRALKSSELEIIDHQLVPSTD
jgi:hypothetical protein